MSSEGKGPIWQGPANWGQEQAFEQGQPQQQQFDEVSSIPPAHRAGISPASTPPLDEDEEITFGQTNNQPLPWSEKLKLLGSDLTYILTPLMLGILTNLIVLPLVANGHVSAPANSLWVIAAMIILVMVAQGIALYFVHDNKGLRWLVVAGGIALFLLVTCFAIFGLAACLTLLIALIVLSIVGARFYFYPVQEGTVDIIYAFGKYSRTFEAGVNILLPWEKVVKHLGVGEIQWLCPMQRVQLSHNEDVHLRATISYQLMPQDAHLVVTQVKNWEENLREYFLACLQNIATTFTPEDFIAWPQGLQTPPSEIEQANSLARRELVNRYLYTQMQDRVALWGVMIHQINIRDVVLAPHDANVIDFATPDTQKAPPEQRNEEQQAALRQINSGPKSEAAPAPAPLTPPAPTPKVLNEEVLKKAYKEIQDGKITSPATIRSIAARFQEVADDPQASQLVTFDAARAAHNLLEQARTYEEHNQGRF